MKKTILLVDDTESMRNLVRDYFIQAGYHVVTAVDGRQALAAALEVEPDLLIVDVDLPDISGYEFMRQHRQRAETPAIILTDKLEASDRIAGLEAGADDCIVTPCSMRELAARAQAVLRRSGMVAPRAEVLVTGDITLDRNGRYLRIDGSYVDLTPSEFELLAAFMSRPGYTLSREELLELLHGSGAEECARTIDVHIKNLRAKIEPDPGHPRYVKTVYGSGYRFAVEQ